MKSNLVTNQPKKIKKISIEGNIASGKSQFLDVLTKLGFQIVQEPIHKWQNVANDQNELTLSQARGGNLLHFFYSDPKRWSFTFQCYAFLSRMKNQMNPEFYLPEGKKITDDSIYNFNKKTKIEKNSETNNIFENNGHLNNNESNDNSNNNSKKKNENILFFERSVFSDRYIFGDNCSETGLMDPIEYGIYQELHTWLIKTFGGLSLDGFVYLRCSPKIAFQRLLKRNRPEEENVSLDYLTQIHERHEKWLNNENLPEQMKDIKKHQILILDVENDFLDDIEKQNELLKKLMDFLENL